mgnify:CR=1 FL=1
MSFRPLRDYVLIEPIERIQSSVLAVVQQEKPSVGRVVAVGPGKIVKGRRSPLDVQPGALVRFGTDAGYLSYPEVHVGAKRLLLMREADVCFIAEPEGEGGA